MYFNSNTYIYFNSSHKKVKEGKFDRDGIKTWAKSMNAPDAAIQALITECENLTDADPCESAVKVGSCIMATAKKNKMKLDF